MTRREGHVSPVMGPDDGSDAKRSGSHMTPRCMLRRVEEYVRSGVRRVVEYMRHRSTSVKCGGHQMLGTHARAAARNHMRDAGAPLLGQLCVSATRRTSALAVSSCTCAAPAPPTAAAAGFVTRTRLLSGCSSGRRRFAVGSPFPARAGCCMWGFPQWH